MSKRTNEFFNELFLLMNKHNVEAEVVVGDYCSTVGIDFHFNSDHNVNVSYECVKMNGTEISPISIILSKEEEADV